MKKSLKQIIQNYDKFIKFLDYLFFQLIFIYIYIQSISNDDNRYAKHASSSEH